MTFCKVFLGIFRRFSKKFMKFFRGLKACIHDTLFAHYAKCFTKKSLKSYKKGVDITLPTWYYIQVAGIQRQTQTTKLRTNATE